MKTLAYLMVATIFLIAPHAYSMTASMGFSLQNSFAPSLQANESGKAKKPRKEKKARASGKVGKGASNVHFFDGSAESTRERERRLTRECKGRSNSGVCEGYTR